MLMLFLCKTGKYYSNSCCICSAEWVFAYSQQPSAFCEGFYFILFHLVPSFQRKAWPGRSCPTPVPLSTLLREVSGDPSAGVSTGGGMLFPVARAEKSLSRAKPQENNLCWSLGTWICNGEREYSCVIRVTHCPFCHSCELGAHPTTRDPVAFHGLMVSVPWLHCYQFSASVLKIQHIVGSSFSK